MSTQGILEAVARADIVLDIAARLMFCGMAFCAAMALMEIVAGVIAWAIISRR